MSDEPTENAEAALAVILARTRCEAIHNQTNNGRCVGCIAWAKRIGVPRHLPRLTVAIAEARREGAAEFAATAEQRLIDLASREDYSAYAAAVIGQDAVKTVRAALRSDDAPPPDHAPTGGPVSPFGPFPDGGDT